MVSVVLASNSFPETRMDPKSLHAANTKPINKPASDPKTSLTRGYFRTNARPIQNQY